jgi:hypothetical protein
VADPSSLAQDRRVPTRGGAAGIRTPDLRRARAALSRLSYGPPLPGTRSGGVGAPGLEPGTSALSGPRSNHLSYAPAVRSTPRRCRPRRHRPGRPGPGLRSGGSSRVAPAPPPARCPRRSARIRARTQQPVSPPWRRRPPRHPERPCQVLPPSRDGKTSGLGASFWQIITRPLDKVEGVETPSLPRKEVIQPQLPLRLPCYDFVPITSPALDGCLPTGNPPGWPTGFRRCRLS